MDYLNTLYDRHNGKGVNFVSIYVSEAHANDEWPIRTKKEFVINQHKTINDRINAALSMIEYTKWQLPLYADCIDNGFRNEFKAWPLRIFIVEYNKKDKDYKLGWMMEPQPDEGLFDMKKIEHMIQVKLNQDEE